MVLLWLFFVSSYQRSIFLVLTEYDAINIQAAVKSGIPVLSMEWIGKAWDAALRGYTTWFGDEDIYSEYRLKIFTDCVSHFRFPFARLSLTSKGDTNLKWYLLFRIIFSSRFLIIFSVY